MNVKTSFLKAGLLVAALSVSATMAHADTLSGSFNINSGDQITVNMTPPSSPTTITFLRDGQVIQPNNGSLVANVGTVANRTGDFVNILQYLQNVAFRNPISITPNGAEELFDTGSYNGHDISFFATSSTISGYTVNGVPNSYAFLGYLEDNGVRVSDGTFTFTDVTSGTDITFTSVTTTAATPEPNSLMLLGTGFVSAAGMLMRRRKALLA